MKDLLRDWFSRPDLGDFNTQQQIIVLKVSSVLALFAGFFLGLRNAVVGFNHLAFFLFVLAGVSALSLWFIRNKFNLQKT